MTTHTGSCHCRRVQFQVRGDVERIVECNCSVCTKKGILHVPVCEEDFRLLAGEAELSCYRFGSNSAVHWFCRHCGIHTHGRPRSDPSRYTVNARCLDEYEDIMRRLVVTHFDGKHHPADRGA